MSFLVWYRAPIIPQRARVDAIWYMSATRFGTAMEYAEDDDGLPSICGMLCIAGSAVSSVGAGTPRVCAW